MNKFSSDLLKITPKHPKEVYQMVAGYNLTALENSQNPISVEITLTNGRTLRGAPCKSNNNDQGVFAVENSEFGVTPLFLNLATISSVEVFNFAPIGPELSDGTIAPKVPEGEEVPTQLNLKRFMSECSESLKAKYGFEIDQTKAEQILTAAVDDFSKYQLNFLFKVLPQAFDAIAADPAGKEALAGVSSLKVNEGPGKLTAKSEGTNLEISFRLSVPFPTPLKDQLVSVIEGAL